VKAFPAGSRRAVLVGAVVSAITATFIGAIIAGPQAAAADPANVAIFLDRLTPVVPQLDDTLRVSGRIVNLRSEKLDNVSVQLRTSAAPLTGRPEISQISELNSAPGDLEPDRVLLESTQIDIANTLAPGAQETFTIKIPMRNLPFSQAGTYVLGIEVLGQVVGIDSIAQRQGVMRTFLPWFPYSSTVTPIELVWLWPVADWPARSAGGVLLDNQTPREISSGGRLDRIVDMGAAASSVVSWIVDSALLQTADVMTRGYRVLSGTSVVIGDRGAEAQAWLDALRVGSATSDVRVLPYADNDASAVRRAGMETDVVRTITMAPAYANSVLEKPVTSTIYWAPFGRIDRRTSDLLASSGVRTVVMAASALPLTGEATPTSSGRATISTSFGSMQAVLVDDGLSATLALPQATRSDALLARQRFLAETAVIAVNLPTTSTSSSKPSRTVVAAPTDLRWNPSPVMLNALLRATSRAPWLGRHSLSDLLNETVSPAGRERGGYGVRARNAELDDEYMDSVRRVQEQLSTFNTILEDPAPLTEQYANALLRAESAAWRTEPETGKLLVDSVRIGLTEQIAQVRVLSEGTITLSGDSGRVPVTIANDLDRAVTVGVQLRSSPSVRLESAPLSGIRIEPGRLASVELDARVIGSQELGVRVQLLTPEGESFGEPARITIASTAYARAAAWVVAIAFLAIVIFVVVGVTRRIRAAQKPSTDANSDTV
jgi:hypothetical protein